MRVVIVRLILALIGWALSSAVTGQTLHTFEEGVIADPDSVNENFDSLRQSREAYSDPSYYQWHLIQVSVDCKKDSFALDEAFNDNLHLSRVSFAISGTCYLPTLKVNPDVGYIDGVHATAQARFVQIKGTCTELGTDGRLVERETGLSLQANNSGVLFLQCVTIENYPNIQAFGNGYVRLDGVRSADDSDLFLSAYDGGGIRIFQGSYPIESNVFSPVSWSPKYSIYADNGSVVRLSGRLTLGSVTLRNGSSMRADGGVVASVDDLTLQMATAEIGSKNFNVGNANIDLASTLVIRLNSDGQSQIEGASVTNSSHLFEY